MVKVIWTNNALDDLEEIGDYISLNSKLYADKLIQSLFYSTEILFENPTAGGVVPEIDLEKYRELIRKSYRVIYLYSEDDEIRILTVHHAARLLENNKSIKELLN
jgi:addiction module RelE/StbE family toxin